MKKLIILLALLVLIVAAVTACGDDPLGTADSTVKVPTNSTVGSGAVITTSKPPVAAVTTDEFGNSSSDIVVKGYEENGFVFDIYANEAKIVSYVGDAAEVTLPATVKDGVKVTMLGTSAFKGSDVTKVTIASSVKKLGSDVFYGCKSLTSVDFGTGVTAIGDGTFRFCEALETAVIPNNVTVIGDDTFYHCTALKNVTLPAGMTALPKETFAHCSSIESVTLPAGITTIGDEAFAFCSSLKSFAFTDKMFAIGDKAFYNCSALTAAEIPAAVTNIPKYAFYSCSSLASVTFKGDVKTIGAYAFYGCASLDSITLPATVKSIAPGAFAYCESLTSIALPASITAISDRVFFKCAKLETVSLPIGIETIGDAAFSYTALKSFTLPATVTSLGGSAFAYCEKLESVDFEAGAQITAFNQLTFTYCTALKEIVFPESVVTVSNGAFSGCSALETVVFNKVVTKLALNSFLNCPSVKAFDLPDTITDIHKTSIGVNLVDGAYVCNTSTKLSAFKDGKVYNALLSAGHAAEAITVTGISGYVGYNEVTYQLVSGTSDQYILTKYNGSASVLKIHETFKDGTVVAIGDDFLKDNATVTELEIPATVTSLGNSAFENCTSLAKVTLVAKSINEENTLPLGIETVGNATFKNTALTTITLGNKVTSIGNSAFEGCSALTSAPVGAALVTLGDAAFKGTAIPTASLPTTLTKLGNEVFADNPQFLSLTLQGEPPVIGTGVLNNTTPMTMIHYPKSSTSYTVVDGKWNGYPATKENYTGGIFAIWYLDGETFKTEEVKKVPIFTLYFNGKLTVAGSSTTGDTIPNFTSAEVLPWYPYREQINALEVKLIKDIGNYTFAELPTITKVELPSTLRTMGEYAFENCTSLTSATFLGTVTNTIGKGAFKNTALTTFDFPKEVTKIAEELFMNCPAIEGVTAKGEITEIGARAFMNSGILAYSMPTKLVTIGDEAFKNCALLTAITTSATKIGASAFEDCVALTSFASKGKVETIGEKALKNTLVKELEFAGDVQTIGDEAFANCTKLVSVKFSGTYGKDKAPKLGKDVFAGNAPYCHFVTTTKNHEFFGVVDNKWNGIYTGYANSTVLATFTMDNGKTVASITFNGKLTINSDGGVIPSFKSAEETPWYSYIPYISILEVNGVTAIGDYAFADFTGTSNITIDSTVKTIGAHAFENCASLSLFTNSADTIGDYAFAGCVKLNTVNLGNAQSVGAYAFKDCSVLTLVTSNNSTTLTVAKAVSAFENTPFGATVD